MARSTGTTTAQSAGECGRTQKGNIVLFHFILAINLDLTPECLDVMKAAITDGVTLGHPCCSVLGQEICRQPLEHPTDLFCGIHRYKNLECRVLHCTKAQGSDKPVCVDHATAWEEATSGADRSKAMHELSKRARRTGITPGHTSHDSSQPLSSRSTPTASQTSPTMDGASNLPEDPKAPAVSLTKRKWTHNEQLCVRPCGVIVSRATMFQAESIIGVKVCWDALVK
jgi:hypothetical protein